MSAGSTVSQQIQLCQHRYQPAVLAQHSVSRSIYAHCKGLVAVLSAAIGWTMQCHNKHAPVAPFCSSCLCEACGASECRSHHSATTSACSQLILLLMPHSVSLLPCHALTQEHHQRSQCLLPLQAGILRTPEHSCQFGKISTSQYI